MRKTTASGSGKVHHLRPSFLYKNTEVLQKSMSQNIRKAPGIFDSNASPIKSASGLGIGSGNEDK